MDNYVNDDETPWHYLITYNAIKSIVIKDGITSIGNYAFLISILTSVTIPNSVINIGNYAFNCCLDLINVTIPSSVTSIGKDVFANCNSLFAPRTIYILHIVVKWLRSSGIKEKDL